MKRDDDQDDDGAQIAEGNVDASADVTASARIPEHPKLNGRASQRVPMLAIPNCRSRLDRLRPVRA